MKRTCLFMLIAAVLFMGSCKSGGSDAEIGTDMCSCFNMRKDSLPKEAIGVFEKAAAAEKPQGTLGGEIQQLDPETAQKVTAEVAAIRLVEEGKTVYSPPYHSAFNTPKGLVLFIK